MKTRRSKGDETDQDDGRFIELELPQDLDVEQLAQLFPYAQLHQPTPHFILTLYKSLLEQSFSIQTLNTKVDIKVGH